jgi:carbon-monoxide dehydrogenase medium subunit
MWTDYFVPATLDEALDLLSRHAPDVRVIAGGTDLVIELDRGARHVSTLIDISRLHGQDGIWLDGDGWIHLGPLVTHSHVVTSALCVERAYPLARACREVGAPQIRNRGTIAGNLITASPANDTITPLMALGARVTLRSVRGSARGQRDVALADFYLGVRRTVMASDEIMTDIAFPALGPQQRGTFAKLGLRRAQAIALVNCAVVVTMDDSGPQTDDGIPSAVHGLSSIVDARITLGAVAPVIVRATDAEAALIGQPLSTERVSQVARLAQQAATPIDDVRSSAAYRRNMVAVLVRRALMQIMNGAERADWQGEPALLWCVGAGEQGSREAEERGSRGAREPGSRSTSSPAPAHLCPPAPMPPRSLAPLLFIVNGREYSVMGAHGKTLLRMLREDCGLTGSKEGCSEGECGACTVIMDGKAVMACLVPAPCAHGTEITTIEGVAQLAPDEWQSNSQGALHPLQQAFIDEGAVQCGYCTPGFIMSGAALLREHAHPTPAQIKESLSGNLCRCTGYYKILNAFDKVSKG